MNTQPIFNLKEIDNIIHAIIFLDGVLDYFKVNSI